MIEKLQKNKHCKKIIKEEEDSDIYNNEYINKITDKAFYDLIIELLFTDSNILIYGYGSKLKLIYDFISYYQQKVNCEENKNTHILVFNCYNPEINIKFILNEIQSYLISQLDSFGLCKNEFRQLNYKTLEHQVVALKSLRNEMINKELCSDILIIMNNIDGPNFQFKTFQQVLSQMVEVAEFRLLATSDNLYLNYFWTQNMKDNFSFYFLKFHTFIKYELEINEKNSLTGEKSLKSGAGLIEVLKSLTKNQKEVLKVMAEIQLKGDLTQMAPKALVEYMVDNGFGICNTQNRFMELIFEPMDHEIIVEKVLPKNNKHIYKLNLDNDILEKIVNGSYDQEEFRREEY